MMDSCGSVQGKREFLNELAFAARILSVGSAPVVPAIGYCSDDDGSRRRWWRLWRRKAAEDPLEAAAGAAAPGRKLLLVYKRMPNGSLHDALLDRRCPELMDWGRRFGVVLDVARSLHFLHTVCDPSVIHGDIKPSNILLDDCLSAKIADFGLSQLMSEGMVIDVHPERCPVNNTAESMATMTGFGDFGAKGNSSADRSIEEDEAFEVASPMTTVEVTPASDASALFDRASVDGEKDLTALGCQKGGHRKKIGTLPGKDRWWKQEIRAEEPNSESGENVKDYVMEWIQSEFSMHPKLTSITASTATSADRLQPSDTERSDQKTTHRRMQWWISLDQDRLTEEEKCQPLEECLPDTVSEDLSNKLKPLTLIKSKSINHGRREPQLWQGDENFTSPLERKRKKKRSDSRDSHSSMDCWIDRMSRDIPKSGATSSTPSTRGTICYVAPEYNDGKPLSEKCDVYSFGVLLLVIISGRRPLKMTTLSMSEFERANLISWARCLAYFGRLLDLVDPYLQSLDREQALLCIRVALLCLQRSPSARPTSKKILSMLTGESKPPPVPLEFSRTPPGGLSFKSRKKAR